MKKAIIIDGENRTRDVISKMINSFGLNIEAIPAAGSVQEGIKAIEEHQPDIVFLDIQMPNKNGVDFYKMLDNNPMVIFTTAHSQYAVEGFNVNATDYLLKPFSAERFMTAAQKARNEFEFRKNQSIQTHLMIRADYKLHRIEFDDILLIEGLDDYVQIHLPHKTKIVARFFVDFKYFI